MYYYGQNYGYPGTNPNYMYPQPQQNYTGWLVIAIIIFVLLIIISQPNKNPGTNCSGGY